MAGKVRQRTRSADSVAAAPTGGSLITDAKLQQLYATMLQCRLLTERVHRLRTLPPSAAFYAAWRGQEAIATGCAIDLQPEDFLSPHESIASLVKGIPLIDIVGPLYAPAPLLAAEEQLETATAMAVDNKKKKNSNVVVAFISQAATTREGWRATLKFAAARSLPIIFVVQNNSGVIQNNGKVNKNTQKLLPGITQMTVDGNDVVAVYRVVYESLKRVREGSGPVVVEAKEYRLDETSLTSRRDPLAHMERYLTAKKLFTARWKEQLVEQFSRELAATVKKAQKAPQ